MATKQGELRVRKGGGIYGPMTREAFDHLLVSGKIARTDQVSVRGGEWIEIAAFMLTPADDAAEDATLRLLAGQRTFEETEITKSALIGRPRSWKPASQWAWRNGGSRCPIPWRK